MNVQRSCNPNWNEDNTFDIMLGAAAAVDRRKQAKAQGSKQAGFLDKRTAGREAEAGVINEYWESQTKIEFRSGGEAARVAGPGRGQTSTSVAAGSHGVTLLTSDSITGRQIEGRDCTVQVKAYVCVGGSVCVGV